MLWCFSKRHGGSKRVEIEEGDCTFSSVIKASRFLSKNSFGGSAAL